jgi:hypothetical protein
MDVVLDATPRPDDVGEAASGDSSSFSSASLSLQRTRPGSSSGDGSASSGSVGGSRGSGGI